MARIRTIKPEFFRHEGLYEAEKASGFPLRVAFAGLWTVADREGRFRWSPRALKLDCLPYDEVDFSRVLDALATRGFIVKYTIDGTDYGFIPSFTQHQVINNREVQSNLPPPHENNDLTRDARVDDATLTPLKQDQGEGKGREGEGKIVDVEVDARARGSTISAEAFDLADELLVLAGHSLEFVPPGWCGAAMRVQSWLNSGWRRDAIVPAVKAVTARKRGPPANSVQFFENAIAEEVARQAAPVPIVEIREPRTITVNGHGKNQPRSGSLIATIDREIAALQAQEDADPSLPKGPVLRLSN